MSMEAILAPSGIGGAEIILRPKLMEVVKSSEVNSGAEGSRTRTRRQ